MNDPTQVMDREALFKVFPRLETERLEMRELALEHAEDLFRIRSQTAGARYGPDPWNDPEQAESRIRQWHKWFLEKEDIPWGIFLRGRNQLIGHLKYAYMRQYLGMIGYHLDVEYWNRGIMTEALRAVVGFLYEQTDAYRLQATAHKDHTVSMRLLEKLGFRREGLLRGRAFWHGRFCDLYMYALLRGETGNLGRPTSLQQVGASRSKKNPGPMMETPRLLLRRMTERDTDELLLIFSDPRVMASFGNVLFDRTQMERWVRRNLEHQDKHGYGLFSVILKESGAIIGDCGLEHREVDGAPEVELGYDLRSDHWGQGLATEAATAVRDFAMDTLGLPRLISLIRPSNVASCRVAEKIGMVKEIEIDRGEAVYWIYAVSKPETGEATGRS